MFGFFKPKAAPLPAAISKRQSIFSTHSDNPIDRGSPVMKAAWEVVREKLLDAQPRLPRPVGAMDSADDGVNFKETFADSQPNISDLLFMWYAAQSFIGYQMAGILAQHWLIDKVCRMPGRDAIQQGYKIVSGDDNTLTPKMLRAIEKANKRMRVDLSMEEFIGTGRVFGVRIAFFKIRHADPLYYEKPFNADSITPGSYEGIVQCDPYWCSPMLDGAAASKADSIGFYEPTWWQINGKRYHKSHLIIFRNSQLVDVLKPVYQYGGIPVPQQIMERIYASERTANEAPLLAMTKRTTIFKTDIAAAYANKEEFDQKVLDWVERRDNQQIKVIDKEADEVEMTDTSLADLDAVIMTNYQLVAAAGRIPATKLMGTSPKGFGASGEYEETTYHQELSSFQKHDLTPFLDRHHLCLMRSEIMPMFGMRAPMEIDVNWNPLDTPTDKEQSEINLANAQAAEIYFNMGVTDAYSEQARLRANPDSGYASLPEITGKADIDDVDGDDDASDVAGSTDETIAEISLNGAQVTSMVDIVSKVATGEMPMESAINILVTAFPIDEQHARKLFAGVTPGSLKNENVTPADNPADDARDRKN